jgi:hypothetical protein
MDLPSPAKAMTFTFPTTCTHKEERDEAKACPENSGAHRWASVICRFGLNLAGL